MVGAAEAAAIEAIGKAEAERMRQKAAAYKQYGDAALMSLILEAMPKVSIVFLFLVFFGLNLLNLFSNCRWFWYYFWIFIDLTRGFMNKTGIHKGGKYF